MKKLILFITLILVLSIAITGCGDKTADKTTDEVKNSGIENEVALEVEQVPLEEEISEEDGQFVNPFSNNNNKVDYYYEMEVISNGASDFVKYWVSGNKSRVELIASDTQDNVISILDGDEKMSYIYQPEYNTVMIRDYEPVYTDYDENNYIDSMKSMFDNENEVKVEKGSFEGQPVQILTGISYGNKSIIWISTKTHFPVKVEYYEDELLAYTTLTRNFTIGPVDQSVFKVPEGAILTD